MQRKVFLKGELAEKFGSVHQVYSTSVKDAVKIIDCNKEGFLEYFRSHQEDAFTIHVHDVVLDEVSLLYPIQEGDITIAPVPGGAGGDSMSSKQKILTGLAILTVLFLPALGPGGNSLWAAAKGAGDLAQLAALTAATVGIQLSVTGIAELMAPDPSTDDKNDPSYLFSGSDQRLIRGNPVPIIYGELRVPGIPISFSTSTNNFFTSNSFVDTRGNLYLI